MSVFHFLHRTRPRFIVLGITTSLSCTDFLPLSVFCGVLMRSCLQVFISVVREFHWPRSPQQQSVPSPGCNVSGIVGHSLSVVLVPCLVVCLLAHSEGFSHLQVRSARLQVCTRRQTPSKCAAQERSNRLTQASAQWALKADASLTQLAMMPRASSISKSCSWTSATSRQTLPRGQVPGGFPESGNTQEHRNDSQVCPRSRDTVSLRYRS